MLIGVATKEMQPYRLAFGEHFVHFTYHVLRILWLVESKPYREKNKMFMKYSGWRISAACESAVSNARTRMTNS